MRHRVGGARTLVLGSTPPMAELLQCHACKGVGVPPSPGASAVS
jgi:hypothetical protein